MSEQDAAYSKEELEEIEQFQNNATIAYSKLSILVDLSTQLFPDIGLQDRELLVGQRLRSIDFLIDLMEIEK